MVPLATNNNCQLGTIRGLSGVKLLERRSDFWNFLFNNDRELALNGGHQTACMKLISWADLRDAVAINQNPLGQISVFCPVGQQTLLHHVLQVRDHLGVR